jgi:hypothetical protein
MKTLRQSLFVLLTLSIICLPTTAQAQAQSSGGLPPKAKAFLMVSGYGAASGALLGLASMAFGTSSRAVAQGASLGLYAGILFGGYVLISHHQRQQQGSYNDNSTPYNDGGYDSDYGEEKSEDSAGGGFFDSSYRAPSANALTVATNYHSLETKKGSTLPPLTINFLNIQF